MCYNLPLYERERKRGGRNKQRSGGMTLEEKYGVKGREEGKKYRSLEWGKLRPWIQDNSVLKIELIFRAQSILLVPYLES